MTSVTKDAASHFVMVCSGGTNVYVAKGVGLFVGTDKVGVGELPVGWAAAPCVDMTLSVSAAAVYRELSVAAGWGASGVKRLQASVTPIVMINIKTLPRRVKDIRASVIIIDHLLGRSKGLMSSS